MSTSKRLERILATTCVLLACCCIGGGAEADERLKAIEEADSQHGVMAAEAQGSIGPLEGGSEPGPEGIESRPLDARPQAIEKPSEVGREGWILSFKGKQLKLGGELELEYVDTQDDEETDQPSGHFQIDKLNLKPHIQITEHIILEGLCLFKADKAYLSEVYAIFSGLPLNSSLKVGLDDRFIKGAPPLKTEGFSLIGTAFARDDELGVTWSGEQRSFYWLVSLSNGLALGEQGPSEDKSYELIHDDRQTGDVNQNKETGLGLGWKRSFAEGAGIDVLAFGYTAKLSPDDIAFLQSIAGYGSSGSDRNNLYGASVECRLKDLSLAGKWIRARDGVLDRCGWFAQASYRVGLGTRATFSAIEPLVRYGHLKVDLPNSPDDPLTWDRTMTTLALLTEMAQDVVLKTEYYLNGEATGGDDVHNDELLVQLEIAF